MHRTVSLIVEIQIDFLKPETAAVGGGNDMAVQTELGGGRRLPVALQCDVCAEIPCAAVLRETGRIIPFTEIDSVPVCVVVQMQLNQFKIAVFVIECTVIAGGVVRDEKLLIAGGTVDGDLAVTVETFVRGFKGDPDFSAAFQRLIPVCKGDGVIL